MAESGSFRGGGVGDYKTFRQTSRDRLFHEMLQSTKVKESQSTWKVLILDKFTVKIMSYCIKMSEITNKGISLVEELFKRREPMISMDAIYFIQPSKENIIMFLSDMSGRCPLYKNAYIYFTSPIPKELVAYIMNDSSVIPRIGALIEMNMEYFAIDSQGFVTDHEMALGDLYGESTENSRNYSLCLNTMATRIATVFASMRELPFVRYQAAKSSSNSTEVSARELIPNKLAAEVWNIISKYKTTMPDFPQKETCDLLIVDRSIDVIAPIIHEWTYDAMCHDLLNMDGNKYNYEVPSKSGSTAEKKEALLEDHDPIWLELRHTHIADASERLHEKMTSFMSKNKAAQLQLIAKDGGELSTCDLRKMVQALPQYSEQIEILSLHVEIAGKINTLIRDLGLIEIGQLEQGLVFGNVGTKEVINFLRTNQDVSAENKLRLLMIYASVYPEKFEGDKGAKLMQLAKLTTNDMNAVYNLNYLGGQVTKKASGGNFSLRFETQKKKLSARKEREGEDETWQLSRFYPLLEELVEKLSKGELQKIEYPYVNEPTPTKQEGLNSGAPSQKCLNQASRSAKSRRTPTWAKQRVSDDGNSRYSVANSTPLV
ncbi:protein transport Sec1a-like isoform X2 [Phalaenopsis equestris]|uniref:protein transport Sec1a-like isoform X2 n=1 Tax=Phalaenopsis equestris TaxID=78828 RepID=UPI0009E382D0|nr:protein transport Sec1a-like isoform X2 [Phalaenopsis equestris]